MKVLCGMSEGIETARKLLVQHLAGLENEKKDGRYRAPYMVEQCAAEFVEFKQFSKSKRTYDDYCYCLQRLVTWYGRLEVGRLSFTHGNDYLRRLKELELGHVSINHHIQAAKAVLNHAVTCGWIRRNPWKQLPKLHEIGRQRIVTGEEFQRLLTACDESDEQTSLQMKDILWFLRLSALRPGELRMLRWDHVHWNFNRIIIPEHKTSHTTRHPKPRVVPFLDDELAILERRRLNHGNSRWVFSTSAGAQWSDDALSKKFARLRARAGLDGKTEHETGEAICLYSLRHTRLTEAGMEEGLRPYVIAAYAGHSVAMTERYIHADADEIAQELRRGKERRTEALERSLVRSDSTLSPMNMDSTNTGLPSA